MAPKKKTVTLGGEKIKYTPGRFTAKAKAAGQIGSDDKIKSSFISKSQHSSDPTTRAQANMAQGFRTMNKKKAKKGK